MPRDKLIQPRKGTAAEWISVDPVLELAEFGYEYDTGKMKMGDGVTAWSSLPYVSWGTGGGGGASWGSITGTLSSQSDLNTVLNARALLTGATFTGSISATNLSGTNTGDQINISGNAGTVTTINGQITAGTNVSLTGAGTAASPYVINASGGGSNNIDGGSAASVYGGAANIDGGGASG